MKNQASRAGSIGARDAERDIYRSKQADKRAQKFDREELPAWAYRGVNKSKSKGWNE